MRKIYSPFIVLLLLLALSLTEAFAQTPQIFKSSGASGSNSTFLLGSTAYARKSQLLFTPGSLTGATAGTINRIYFRYGSSGVANGQTLTNFTVRLGQPAAASFSQAATGYNFFTGLDTVLAVPTYSIPAGTNGNWFSIDLTTAFTFDPAQSLVVELKFDSSSTANFGTLGGSNTPVRKVVSPDVNATSGSGTSSAFQDFGFDLGAVTGITHQLVAQKLEIYPSPASQSIWIRSTNQASGKTKLQVLNSHGQIVLRKVVNASAVKQGYELQVQNLEPGMYYVTLEAADLLQQGAVIVIH